MGRTSFTGDSGSSHTAAMKRYHWADVAKGLLILLVVFHHLPQAALAKGWDTPMWNNLNETRHFYCCFFMAAFFFITGYCSNFEKPFITFLRASFKSLIVPAITISVLLFAITSLFSGKPMTATLKGICGLLIMGGGNWFLSSLFVARILYWSVNHYAHTEGLKLLLCLILMIIGFSCHDMGLFNLWFFEHALAMVYLLFIGDYSKKKWRGNESALRKISLFGSLLFLAAWAVLFFAGKPIPSLNAHFRVTTAEIPLYLILSLSGTCLILYVSMLIKSNKLLEFLGKNSLTIYLFQGVYIALALWLLSRLFCMNATIQSQVVGAVVSFVTVLLLCTETSVLLNTKHLKVLIGK